MGKFLTTHKYLNSIRTTDRASSTQGAILPFTILLLTANTQGKEKTYTFRQPRNFKEGILLRNNIFHSVSFPLFPVFFLFFVISLRSP